MAEHTVYNVYKIYFKNNSVKSFVATDISGALALAVQGGWDVESALQVSIVKANVGVGCRGGSGHPCAPSCETPIEPPVSAGLLQLQESAWFGNYTIDADTDEIVINNAKGEEIVRLPSISKIKDDVSELKETVQGLAETVAGLTEQE